MNKTIRHYFKKLDNGLAKLAQSDSAMNRSHVKGEFNEVVHCVNLLRTYLGLEYVDPEDYYKKLVK